MKQLLTPLLHYIFGKANYKIMNEGCDLRWCVSKDFSLESFAEYIKPSIVKGHLTNDGPLQVVAGKKLTALVQSARSILLAANGTAALHALAAGFEIKFGKRLRWATQAFTFPSSIQGPFCSGLVLDIDDTVIGPSLEELGCVKDSIDGVVVTNIFGLQSSPIRYERWCKEHGKILIFDNAATPFGFVEDGRCIHDVGDGAIVSLHETKPVGRGEGGAVFVDPDMVQFVHQAMNFGFDTRAAVREPHRYASNWRMSDVAAAMLCNHWDNIIKENWFVRHQDLLRFAEEQIALHEMALVPKISYPTMVSCLFVRFKKILTDEQLDTLVSTLNQEKPRIEAKRYYRPLCSEGCPEAWKLYRSCLCLPFHLGLSEEMVSFEIMTLAKHLEQLVGIFDE